MSCSGCIFFFFHFKFSNAFFVSTGFIDSKWKNLVELETFSIGPEQFFTAFFLAGVKKLYFELVLKLSDVWLFFKKVYLLFLFMFKFFIVIIRFNLSGERFF